MRVFVKESAGCYTEIPNGPFPVTVDQLNAARARFAEQRELARGDALAGIHQAPVAAARLILALVVPSLDSFDREALAYAVTARRVRMQDEHGTRAGRGAKNG